MAYREFVDSCRIKWAVWYVAASRSERRERETRRNAQRANGDRRRRESYPRRMRVNAPMSAGWLCFESASQKRRLAPVPRSWQRMSDRRLEELCARAAVTAKSVRLWIRPRSGKASAVPSRTQSYVLEHALPRCRT
jgi:hypothetical protein